MVVTIKIQRSETRLAKKARGNLLIYGRRKVGKTYLIKEFLDFDIYVFVKRGGGMLLEGGPAESLESYEQFLLLFTQWMADGKTVVVDEFQRLPGDFLDLLQAKGGKGRVILSGSSFHVVKDVLSHRSPLLGIVSEIRLSLITPVDILLGLCEEYTGAESMELAPYLRDPWLLPMVGDGCGLGDALALSKGTVKAIIGEAFLEEDRELTRTYEGIIRALALGHWKLNEISNLLHARMILERPDPHAVRPYFNNMEEMDLVHRIPIYGKNGNLYVLRSPIMEAAFSLDERYDFFQRDLSPDMVRSVLTAMKGRHIERFIGDLFAQLYDGVFEHFYSSDFDIDFIITRSGKAVASGEVKWGRCSKNDIDLFLERTKHIPGEKIFISKTDIKDARVTSLSPDGLVGYVRKNAKGR
jgi:hypothetical protein